MANEGILTGKIDNGITWTYTGGVLNGLRHGKGITTWSDGDVYEGDWVNGKLHGKGKLTLADGEYFEGNFINGEKHGKGKYTFPDGAVYEGNYVNDKFHGKGKFTFPNGSVYEGDFVDGEKHGKGKNTSANGSIYEGDWVNGNMYGKGKLTVPDGDVYEGDFVDNQIVRGIARLSNGDVYEGNFGNNGSMLVSGKYTYADGSVEVDYFVNNKWNGKGKAKLGSGDVYEGNFVDGKPSGKGKFVYADGDAFDVDVYKGAFVDRRLTGKGKFIFSDGSVYEGDFQYSEGKATKADGTVQYYIDRKQINEYEMKAYYNDLVQAKNNASSEGKYKQLATEFRKMGDYENAAQLADECEKQVSIFKEQHEEQEQQKQKAREREYAQKERKEKKKKLTGLLLQLGIMLAFLCVPIYFGLNFKIIIFCIISLAFGFISLIFRRNVKPRFPWGVGFLIFAYAVTTVTGSVWKGYSMAGSIISVLIPAAVLIYIFRRGMSNWWSIGEYIKSIIIFIIVGGILSAIVGCCTQSMGGSFNNTGNYSMFFFILSLIPAFPGMIMISKVESKY